MAASSQLLTLDAVIVTRGEQLHTVSVPLDVSKDAPDRPVGAVEEALEGLKDQVNAYLSERVDEERAESGGAAADDDGWHELNEDAAVGAGSDDELDARGKGTPVRQAKKRKNTKKVKS
mmetsp:Transcript_13867/g.35947  ORF Transcript_13867/g.35947 Transcript_13867/m.35947 type:complete len:119 (-) Transcript_13867:414-770(-)